MLYRLIRPVLFLFTPENAHRIAMRGLQMTCRFPFLKGLAGVPVNDNSDGLGKTCFGLDFPNPIGLAAGFDKNAEYVDALAELGFGFIEIGTVTPRAQEGNPKPRLFRIPADNALINRMGFNNEGVQTAAANLSKRKSSVIIGGNIGKNKVTPNEKAFEDYLASFEVLYPHVDYFVVNVSSPNTPGLRELQEKEPLRKLLNSLLDRNATMAAPKPVLLKIAPDLGTEQLEEIAELATECKLNGLIISNTTIERKGLKCSPEKLAEIGAGGLSGKPLTNRSTDIIRKMRSLLPDSMTIIGVGGIFTPQDAIDKLEAGADLVQVYTGFIYEGPGMISRIKRRLEQRN